MLDSAVMTIGGMLITLTGFNALLTHGCHAKGCIKLVSVYAHLCCL